MKKLPKIISKAVAVISFAILLVGCNKSYKTTLADNEGIPSAVVIDGRPDGGKVKRVYVDGAGRRIAEFTVSRDSEGLIREGVIRIPGANAIQLRTDVATGQPLPSGSYIHAESNLGVAAKKWGIKALAIIALAAAAAVICLRRFLAFRAAAPFIPLLVATSLALLSAYSAHGLIVPITSDLLHKIRAKAPSSNDATPSLGTSTAAPEGWAGKARVIERDSVTFLRTPTDAPRLLAFITTFAITLPLFACLIAWLFRKLAYQPVVSALLFLAAAPSVLEAAPKQTGVSYTRDFLREEQRFCRQTLSEAERDLTTASRLLDAHLTGAPELLVRGLFLTDLVGIRLEGHSDRIVQLKSAFGYVRAEEQRKLSGAYSDLRQQLQTVQLDAAKSSERCTAATNALSVLHVFQARQADCRNLIRAGLADPKTVLDDCRRQLNALLAQKAQGKSQDTDRSAVELARLRREQTDLQAQLTELRRANQAERPPLRIVLTNEIVRTVEKTLPAPPPVFITNTERLFITNTVLATNPVLHVNASSSSVTQAEVRTSTPLVKPPTIAGSSKAANPTTNRIFVVGKAALPWIGLICISGLCAAIYAFLAAARTGTIQLAVDGRVLDPIEITSNEDAIILNAQPLVKAKTDAADKTHLSPTWLGTILRPGREMVTINEVPTTKPTRVHHGDKITVQNEEHVFHQFDFLGWDRNSGTAEA